MTVRDQVILGVLAAVPAELVQNILERVDHEFSHPQEGCKVVTRFRGSDTLLMRLRRFLRIGVSK